jgi:hypothetical protein
MIVPCGPSGYIGQHPPNVLALSLYSCTSISAMLPVSLYANLEQVCDAHTHLTYRACITDCCGTSDMYMAIREFVGIEVTHDVLRVLKSRYVLVVVKMSAYAPGAYVPQDTFSLQGFQVDHILNLMHGSAFPVQECLHVHCTAQGKSLVA